MIAYSSSFDESLPETSTVTLNHHQHDVSYTATPTDRRSINDDDDSDDNEPDQHHPSSSWTSKSASKLSTRTTQTDRPPKASTSPGAVPDTPALYAVPLKAAAAARRAASNADVVDDQNETKASLVLPKPTKNRPGASSNNRPRIPAELMSINENPPKSNGENGLNETEDDLGFDDVINMATANGYADHTDQKVKAKDRHVDMILPPPKVFSDDNTTWKHNQTNGKLKSAYTSQPSNSRLDDEATVVFDAVYSEVAEVSGPLGAASRDNADRKLPARNAVTRQRERLSRSSELLNGHQSEEVSARNEY